MTEPITDVIERVERLSAEATPGLWLIDSVVYVQSIDTMIHTSGGHIVVRKEDRTWDGEAEPTAHVKTSRDAALIAAYRSDAPRLAAALEIAMALLRDTFAEYQVAASWPGLPDEDGVRYLDLANRHRAFLREMEVA